MPDQTFYVGAQDKNDRAKVTGYVPARFLIRRGRYVMDPMPGGSQGAFLYSDASGSNKTNGKIANPFNYLIVPNIHSEQKARNFAAGIAGTWGNTLGDEAGGAMGLSQALMDMRTATPAGRLTRPSAKPAMGYSEGLFRSGLYRQRIRPSRVCHCHQRLARGAGRDRGRFCQQTQRSQPETTRSAYRYGRSPRSFLAQLPQHYPRLFRRSRGEPTANPVQRLRLSCATETRSRPDRRRQRYLAILCCARWHQSRRAGAARVAAADERPGQISLAGSGVAVDTRSSSGRTADSAGRGTACVSAAA